MPLKQLTGQAVLPDCVGPVLIEFNTESGLITSVELFDGLADRNLVIFPGFIDAHVHAREYPRPATQNSKDLERWEATCRKETFESAGRAALNGGVTLYCAMPNDPNPPVDEITYNQKKSLASISAVPVVTYSAITPSSEPWADVPYKVYLDPTPSLVNFTSWSDLEEVLRRYSGYRVFFHAEDPDVLRNFDSIGPRWQARPPQAEIQAVEKILEYTAKLGLRTHMCHVSTSAAVDLIADFNRSSSDPVTCEATPHHLFFSVEDSGVKAPTGANVPNWRLLDCNPPLRSEQDRQRLVDALESGLIDILGTDHAPHTLQDKATGAPGMPHLDTLGSFVGWLVLMCGFTLHRISEILSSGPAHLFQSDLEARHGAIEPGAIASFSILDLGKSIQIDQSEILGRGPLQTRCAWSPFSGMSLPAQVKGTVVRGKEYWAAGSDTDSDMKLGQ